MKAELSTCCWAEPTTCCWAEPGYIFSVPSQANSEAAAQRPQSSPFSQLNQPQSLSLSLLAAHWIWSCYWRSSSVGGPKPDTVPRWDLKNNRVWQGTVCSTTFFLAVHIPWMAAIPALTCVDWHHLVSPAKLIHVSVLCHLLWVTGRDYRF